MVILAPDDARSRENQANSFLNEWEVSLVHGEEPVM